MRPLLALVLVLTIVPTAARAGDAPPSRQKPLTLQWENDMFAGTDRHYTNGMRATLTIPAEDTPKTLEDILLRLSHLNKTDDPKRRLPQWMAIGIGQDMFTPTDRAPTGLIAADRPYAGWLYLAAAAHRATECGPASLRSPCMDSVELDIGMVGPSALAKQTQDMVHNARGIPRFNGWDNQLKDEPAFLLTWERRKKWIEATPDGLGYDVIPRLGASLGTVKTQAEAGATLRLGWNIPDDFGPPAAIKSVANPPPLGDAGLGAYLFAGFDGRFVARNVFLDGNTFRDSHSVEKEPWVYDLPIGFAVQWSAYRLSLARVFRSKEFKEQTDNSRFSSITLTAALPF